MIACSWETSVDIFFDTIRNTSVLHSWALQRLELEGELSKAEGETLETERV